ncbi:DMT family transporter [Profundibacter sp.]
MNGITWALLLGLAALWGGSFFWAEVALEQVPPLTIVLFRVTLAIPVLAIFIKWKGLSIPRRPRIWAAYMGMGALNNAVPFSLIVWGQVHISGGTASILNATTAVFGAVVAGLLLADEPLTPRKLVGASVGVAGVMVIMGPDAIAGFDLDNLAHLAVLAAALSYALASVWGKVFLTGIAPEVNAFGMVTCAAIWMLPLALWQDGWPGFDYSAPTWRALIGLSWLATATAYLLYFSILRRAGAANLMLVTLLIPPFAVGFGWLFLAETQTASSTLGYGIIAIGLAITDGRMFGRR